MQVQCTCSTCGKPFARFPSEVKARVYCSVACRWKCPPLAISEDGLTAFVPLRAIDGSVRAHAIIDAADAAFVNQWRWSLLTVGYACRNEKTDGRTRLIYLHRELMGLPRIADSRHVDHIDRDKLNLTRSNLRIVTKAQNEQNRGAIGGTSEHRGVCWNRVRQLWKAAIQVDGRTINVGHFPTEEEAAKAALAARRRHMPYAVD
jgi:hypothetical protein